MYYDSMIAKLIVHGARPRRRRSRRMREALNGFVIRGIVEQHRVPVGAARASAFAAGDFNTGFIAEDFAQGLRSGGRAARRSAISCSRSPPPCDRRLLRRARRASSGQLPGHELRDRRRSSSWSSRRRRQAHARRRSRSTSTATATDVTHRAAGRARISLASALRRRSPSHGTRQRRAVPCPGRARAGSRYRVAHDGAQVEARVLTPRAAELLRADAVQGAARPVALPALADAGPARRGRGGGRARRCRPASGSP